MDEADILEQISAGKIKARKTGNKLWIRGDEILRKSFGIREGIVE